eukprot:UN07157
MSFLLILTLPPTLNHPLNSSPNGRIALHICPHYQLWDRIWIQKICPCVSSWPLMGCLYILPELQAV